jgi:hypothetical protein
LKGESEMKFQLFKGSTLIIALLILLSLHTFAGMAVFVNAAATKYPTVQVNGSGLVELTWKSGKSQVFSSDAYANLGGLYAVTVLPAHGWHIDAVFIDGKPQNILDDHEFSLVNVQAKNMIFTTFLENNGTDDVGTGSNVEAYPYPNVGLIFDNVLVNGFADAYTIWLQPPEAKGESWDIQTNAVFDQNVTVILVLNLTDLSGFNATALRLLRTEVGLARADVNSDGKVDGTDVSIVANANPSSLGDPKYNAALDMDNNGVINDEDVNIVNNYIGESVWQDITLQVVVDNGLVYVYGLTDHFSIFGIH